MATSIDNLSITGNLTVKSDGISAQTRSSILRQDANVHFPIPLTSLRTWDALATNLPGTAATDDLALITGTFGTGAAMVQAGDLKAAGATSRYARFIAIVPECYETGETLTLNVFAGMITTIADTSCTLDVEAYLSTKLGAIGSDLCSTAAQSINSLVVAEKTFVITASGIAAGDVLDIRLAIACNDGATGTAVIPAITNIDLVCDIKG